MNELEIRLLHGGAFKRCGKIFCSVHGTELNQDGSCGECVRTDMIIGADIVEADAMRRSQEALEHDV